MNDPWWFMMANNRFIMDKKGLIVMVDDGCCKRWWWTVSKFNPAAWRNARATSATHKKTAARQPAKAGVLMSDELRRSQRPEVALRSPRHTVGAQLHRCSQLLTHECGNFTIRICVLGVPSDVEPQLQVDVTSGTTCGTSIAAIANHSFWNGLVTSLPKQGGLLLCNNDKISIWLWKKKHVESWSKHS